MDGYEVARHLHARERSHHVPILFLTAIDASPDRVVEGYAVGAVDFLSKPFHPDVLRAKVSVFAEPDRRARLLLEAELREPGRVREGGAPLWIPDVADAPALPRAEAAGRAGIRSAFAFPERAGGEVTGVLEFFAGHAAEPDPGMLQAMDSIGGSIGQFLEKRRAEAALAGSEERYRALAEASPYGIVEMDDRSVVLSANPAVERIFGYPPGS